MYEKILIPTDGNDGSEQVIEHAIELAKIHDAEVHTLYVLNVGDLAPAVHDEYASADVRDRGERAVAAVERRAAIAGIDAITEAFVRGVTHEAIVAYAEDHGIDLVVLRTGYRSDAGGFLSGSVTERVVENASVPVLTIPTTPKGE